MKLSELIAEIKNGKKDEELKELYGSDALEAQKERYISVIQKTIDLFSDGEGMVFSAPGRTEVGGNHTDHQLGRVLAASIDLDTIAAVIPTEENIVRLASLGFEIKPVDLSDLSIQFDEKNTTEALIRGTAGALAEKGWKVGGFMAYSESNVIAGGGMSSSAAFEVLLGTIQNVLYNDGQIPAPEIAKAGQYAENRYFMKACGLMDQMASAVGSFVAIDFFEKDNPLVEKVDFDPGDYDLDLILTDTRADHSDLSDEYSAIPTEMKGVALTLGEDVLSRCTMSQFLRHIPEIREKCGDRAFLRAYHFLCETQRAEDEKIALREKKIDEFLRLVNESGRSSWMYLQNICVPGAVKDQQVAVGLALSAEILGSEGACRVHGGGFAGTIQAFVPKAKTAKYIKTLESAFGEGCCYILKIRGRGGIRVM